MCAFVCLSRLFALRINVKTKGIEPCARSQTAVADAATDTEKDNSSTIEIAVNDQQSEICQQK